MNKDKKVYVDINNARSEKYAQQLQQIIDNGDDPFSMEYIQKYHPKPILKIGKYWYVTEIQDPYENAKQHFLIISNTFVETFKDMSDEAFSELRKLNEEVCEEYGITGGALCMRFGETSITGATVKRLHAHLIATDIEKGTVKFPVGRRKRE